MKLLTTVLLLAVPATMVAESGLEADINKALDGCYGSTICAQQEAPAGNWSLGFLATETTWNTVFGDLQTPGWNTAVHPGGCLDLQWKSAFIEGCADPHRPREATAGEAGLRHDLIGTRRITLFGEVSAGVFEAPSFNQYCWSYEYMNGDCHAGNKPPEYCPWFSFNGAIGLRIKVGKKFWIEPARFKYLGVFGIGPRFQFAAGFRIGL